MDLIRFHLDRSYRFYFELNLWKFSGKTRWNFENSLSKSFVGIDFIFSDF